MTGNLPSRVMASPAVAEGFTLHEFARHRDVWGNCLFAVAAGDDPELVEPALERAVTERRAARGLEPDQLGQAQVGGKNEAAPSCEALLQRIAEPGVERGQLVGAADALAVGRIGHEHARA